MIYLTKFIILNLQHWVAKKKGLEIRVYGKDSIPLFSILKVLVTKDWNTRERI